jgi:histidinol phosphatase-like enzyme
MSREHPGAMKFRKTLCIDFDGVIHCHHAGYTSDIDGEWMTGAKEAIEELHRLGFHLFVLTARPTTTDHEKIKAWMSARLGPDIMKHIEVTNIKQGAMFYIDDRALRFTNWSDMLNYIR